MLHRLLTLPSQLLEDEEEDTDAKETLATLAVDGASDHRDGTGPPSLACPSSLTKREEDEEEEEEEDEEKGRKVRKGEMVSWLMVIC